MTKAIVAYCHSTGQITPNSHKEFVRCIYESLALKYKYTLGKLKKLAPFEIEQLHVIGGGSLNKLLNQWTANAIGIPVITGPAEATAYGNIMIQAKAAGIVNSLQEMRQIIRESIHIEEYHPQSSLEWGKAYNRFIEIINH
jgi:rhamnulokinase